MFNNMIVNIGYALNILIWFICLIAIKSIKYVKRGDIEFVTNENEKKIYHLKEGREYQTIKLPILAWIVSLLLILCPYFGGFMIAIQCHILLCSYTDETYSDYITKNTDLYLFMIRCVDKLKYILNKIFGWLFVQI